jgi:hypothetical protein
MQISIINIMQGVQNPILIGALVKRGVIKIEKDSPNSFNHNNHNNNENLRFWTISKNGTNDGVIDPKTLRTSLKIQRECGLTTSCCHS